MKNNLKQTSLFDRLKYHKITVKQYINIYLGYIKGEIKNDSPEYKILKSIDDLFAPKKKLKLDDLMGIDYSSKLICS